ncbi:MAG: fatty acid desaturase family protein [Gammaproteobacteria bacterium]|nr:fatty acid desaturase family protein [Gammaproteobacteria bacterium]
MVDVKQWLSEEEVRGLTARSDAQGLIQVAYNWTLITAIFLAVSYWQNPLSWLLGVLLLGGRQLGLAILMHEAGHGTLFQRPGLNRLIGQWFCAFPILSSLEAYATSHRGHHARAGSQEDPDLANYVAYPVSVSSFRRKVFRDLSGRTGLRNLFALVKGEGGDLMTRGSKQQSPLVQGVVTNSILAIVLLAAGVGELYLMWVVAYLTIYPFAARVRQLAEHGNVNNLYDPDPRQHTRTTLANGFERLLICPNRVNFHCEHHLLASVPCYRLPALHGLLRSRGFYDEHGEALTRGYWAVVRNAVSSHER